MNLSASPGYCELQTEAVFYHKFRLGRFVFKRKLDSGLFFNFVQLFQDDTLLNHWI